MYFQPVSIRVFVAVQSLIAGRFSVSDDRGQATAEYSLVILGAAAVALLVITWATKTSKVATLLNKVIEKITSQVA